MEISGFYTDGALILKQARKLGLNVPAMGTYALYHPEFIRLGGDAVEGTFVSTPFFPGDPRKVVADFVKRFRAKYNEDPSLYAAFAYDSMKLLAKAMEIAGADNKSIRDALAGFKDLPGVTGVITFDENGDRVPISMVTLQVKGGKFELYKP